MDVCRLCRFQQRALTLRLELAPKQKPLAYGYFVDPQLVDEPELVDHQESRT